MSSPRRRTCHTRTIYNTKPEYAPFFYRFSQALRPGYTVCGNGLNISGERGWLSGPITLFNVGVFPTDVFKSHSHVRDLNFPVLSQHQSTVWNLQGNQGYSLVKDGADSPWHYGSDRLIALPTEYLQDRDESNAARDDRSKPICRTDHTVEYWQNTIIQTHNFPINFTGHSKHRLQFYFCESLGTHLLCVMIGDDVR